MIALEEKITTLATLFVEKRDGRRVAFDVDKIDKAIHKAADKVMDVTPLVEKRLNALPSELSQKFIVAFHRGLRFTKFKIS